MWRLFLTVAQAETLAEVAAATYYLPVAEGGTPLSLWYDRTVAEQDRDAKQKLAADEVAAAMISINLKGCLFNLNRKAEAAAPFADGRLDDDPVPVGEAPHCELIEVERGDVTSARLLKPLGDTAFVVMRLSWDTEIENSEIALELFDRSVKPNIDAVPVRVFALRSEAQQFCEQTEAEYRSFANPFRFRAASLPHIGWDSAAIVNAVQNLGIAAPFPNPHLKKYDSYRRTCVDWWMYVADGLSEHQRKALWAMTWVCEESGPLVFYTIVQLA